MTPRLLADLARVYEREANGPADAAYDASLRGRRPIDDHDLEAVPEAEQAYLLRVSAELDRRAHASSTRLRHVPGTGWLARFGAIDALVERDRQGRWLALGWVRRGGDIDWRGTALAGAAS